MDEPLRFTVRISGPLLAGRPQATTRATAEASVPLNLMPGTLRVDSQCRQRTRWPRAALGTANRRRQHRLGHRTRNLEGDIMRDLRYRTPLGATPSIGAVWVRLEPNLAGRTSPACYTCPVTDRLSHRHDPSAFPGPRFPGSWSPALTCTSVAVSRSARLELVTDEHCGGWTSMGRRRQGQDR